MLLISSAFGYQILFKKSHKASLGRRWPGIWRSGRLAGQPEMPKFFGLPFFVGEQVAL